MGGARGPAMKHTNSTAATTTTPRGRACVPCRTRKRKCDGATPICQHCIRRSQADECEYVGRHEASRLQILEREVERLERRLYELEHPEAVTPNISLHDPYLPVPDECSSVCSLLVKLEEGFTHTNQYQSSNILQTITTSFLLYAAEYNFFLHIPRFHQSIILPTASIPRPTRGLMLMLYLYGVRFSRDSSLLKHEAHLLDHALMEATIGVDSHHPYGTVHYLQAEVLLANYLFSVGRLIEARYHIHTATSISLSWSQRPHLSLDLIATEEMIHASQIVSCLEASWAVELGVPLSGPAQ